MGITSCRASGRVSRIIYPYPKAELPMSCQTPQQQWQPYTVIAGVRSQLCCKTGTEAAQDLPGAGNPRHRTQGGAAANRSRTG